MCMCMSIKSDGSLKMLTWLHVLTVFLWLCVDTFTDSAIASTRVNGDHREKVLQRWDGGDSNGENYDLEADAVS